jgi:hypothetical protein
MPNLAYTKKELLARSEVNTATPMYDPGEAPRYPWGLELCFDQSVLKKLARSASDFKIGDEIPVQATLRVRSLRSEETVEGEDSTVGFTMIAVELPKTDGERAAKLFPAQSAEQGREASRTKLYLMMSLSLSLQRPQRRHLRSPTGPIRGKRRIVN